jgi:GT2 family glycosyltransferase
MTLSVLIISYNTRDLTLACLGSLYQQTRGGLEVVVVDNASTDGSADAIAAAFPQARLIRSEQNLGFAAGNNLAAAEAKGDYLLLLNPDTVIMDGAVDKLLEFAQANPQAGIWGGRTVFADGTLNPASCWARQTPWSVFCVATGLSSLFRRSRVFNREGYGGWARDCVRQVEIVSGCFLLIRRDLWEQLGGFDPAFFMYGEEADLCLRAAALGARPMMTPEATIVHHGGASERVRGEKLVRLLKAKVLLIRRHWPRGGWFGVACLTTWPLTRAAAWSALGVVRGGRARDSAREWWGVWKRHGEWAGKSARLARRSREGEQRDRNADLGGTKRILAIASGGGHWVQLLRLRPAFEGHRVAYATVKRAYQSDVAGERFYLINDATRWNKFGLVRMAARIAWILLRERPHVVVSTGAAPGFFALRLGRMLGARTVWLDSIANAEKMSMTGELVGKHADLWLTQWEHLAEKGGDGARRPRYEGAVL